MSTTTEGHGRIVRTARRAALVAGILLVLVALPGALRASAAACSNSTGAASCTVTGNLTITAGTLSLEAPPSLYWAIVGTGYDQWASASATSLTACSAVGSLTHCSSGTAPVVQVLDATGSGSGWAVSEYLSANTLPSGYALTFNGAGGATYGYSQVSPVATDPFAGTTPGSICDYASTCTTPTAAGACSHAGLGFASCPAYPVTMAGTDAAHQIDLYSAAAATGLGAVCFASGTASSTGCSGATPTAFFNLGVKGSSAPASTSVTINMAVTSGP